MVTMQPIIQVGAGSFLLRFSSDQGDPIFYIYLDGILIAETTATEYTIAIAAGNQAIVEVLDDADAEPTEVFPGNVRLGWFFVDGVDYYRIDEYIAGEWTQRARVTDNQAYRSWQSRFLEDGGSHQFRVVAIGTDGNEATAREFTVLMVRHPDSPDVSYAYSAGTVTISEN